MREAINHAYLLNCNIYFKYLAILSGNYIFKNWKRKKIRIQCFSYNIIDISDDTLGI